MDDFAALLKLAVVALAAWLICEHFHQPRRRCRAHRAPMPPATPPPAAIEPEVTTCA